MFYQSRLSTATGTQAAWTNAGVNYTFGANGQLNPPVTTLTLANVTVDGDSLGNIQLQHSAGGITQFADSNGSAQVNLLQQNGFSAGSASIGGGDRQGPHCRYLLKRPNHRSR